jgi:tRNA pseudouridine synthase 10
MFNSSIEIKISSKSTLDSQYLKKLKNICNDPVMVYEKSGKRFEKQIFSLSYKKLSLSNFSLFMKVEGGLPIRRFIEGGDVSPNISDILNCKCTCEEFDFHDIEV